MRLDADRSTRLLAGLALATSLGFAGVECVAQPGGAPNAQDPEPPRTIVAFERAPLNEFLVDARDEGLRRAVSMIPARLDELPGEIPDMDQQDALLLRLIATTLAKRSRVAVAYTPGNQKGGAMGYGVVMSTPFANAKEADELHRAVTGAIERAGGAADAVPSELFPGMTEFRLPVAPLRIGPRMTKQGPAYDIIFGAIRDPDAALAAIPAKPMSDAKPVIFGMADAAPLATAIGLLSSSPQTAFMGRSLAAYGLIGDPALAARFEMGYSKDAMVSRVRVSHVAKALDKLGIAGKVVTKADLAAIPASATHASIGAASTRPVIDLIKDAGRQGAPIDQFLNQFQQIAGVDLIEDYLKTLGGVSAVYRSEATGGGGLGSMVFMITFEDRAKFLKTHEKILGGAREFLRSPDAMGENARYVCAKPWRDEACGDAAQFFSIMFPGVPIPFEVSYAVTERWLIAALTPQATIAAARQAVGKGDAGIASRADLAPFKDRLAGPMVSFKYGDTRRDMRAGYSILSLACSALANGVRSPGGASRDPGLILPPFNDLAAGVRPAVSITTMQGEELVMDSVSERSVLAAGAGAIGAMSDFLPVIALIGVTTGFGRMRGFGLDDAAGAGLPVLADARRDAKAMPWLEALEPAAARLAPSWWARRGFAELAMRDPANAPVPQVWQGFANQP